MQEQKAEMAEDSLDDYIDAASKALRLPVKEAWKPAVRANLEAATKKDVLQEIAQHAA